MQQPTRRIRKVENMTEVLVEIRANDLDDEQVLSDAGDDGHLYPTH